MPRGWIASAAVVTVFVTGLLGVLLGTLSADAADSAPPPQGMVYVVDGRGSDARGDGSPQNPWRTLAKACRSVPGGRGDTIRIDPGTFTESDSCALPCKTNLRGSGRTATTLKGSADPIVRVTNCMRRGNAQTISGLHLDGQNKSAGRRGMSVENVRNLTITDMQIESFKGTATGGGALNLKRIWNVEVKDSVFRNSAAIFSDYATGTLGIGDATDSVFHDLTIHDAKAFGVKGDGGTLTNVEFYNLRCTTGSPMILSWPGHLLRDVEMPAVNVTIRNSYFNATVSLTDGSASQLSAGRRYNIHNNHFDIPSEAKVGAIGYALELDQNSSEVYHNYFDGGVHPIAYFGSDVKRGQLCPSQRLRQPGELGSRDALPLRPVRFRVLQEHGRDATEWFNYLFKVDELTSSSSPAIRDNIFWSAYPIGDTFGLGLDDSNIDRNDFYNVAARGKNPLIDDPELPLTGRFRRVHAGGRKRGSSTWSIRAGGLVGGSCQSERRVRGGSTSFRAIASAASLRASRQRQDRLLPSPSAGRRRALRTEADVPAGPAG